VTCPICNTRLDPAAGTSHPNCAPWADSDENSDAVLLKHELMEIILWADKGNPRSRQQKIGPSEIGVVCDRRVGYRIAEIPPINVDSDPWPAIVGTAIHNWLDQAIRSWGEVNQSTRWRTETPVQMGEFVTGRSDLFDTKRGIVVDHKGAGREVLREVRVDGPKPEHKVQVQTYGLGYSRLGYQVKKVALVYYPRAGWLRDSYVWVDDYDPEVAYAALDRLGDISRTLVALDVIGNPHRWEQVPATPSNACGLCSWYNPGRDAERGADNTGCPGK